MNMKKSTHVLGIAGSISLLLVLGVFLAMMGPLVTWAGEAWTVYDWTFGNQALQATANGGMITAFILTIIAAVVILLSLAFSWGKGSHKFAGFFYMVGAVLAIIAGVLFFLGRQMIGDFLPGQDSYSLSYGVILAASLNIVGGLISGVFGFLAFKK